jgi:Glycosyltransferase
MYMVEFLHGCISISLLWKSMSLCCG